MKTNLKKLLPVDGDVLYGKLVFDREYNDYEHDWCYHIYMYEGWDGEYYYNFNASEHVKKEHDMAYINYLLESKRRTKKYVAIKDNRKARRKNYTLSSPLPF